MFQIGEQVCYPMHGIGVIEHIEQQSILGEQTEYYVLRFSSGNMTAMVPVETAESVGIRVLSDESECRHVLEYFAGPDMCEDSSNWNQRYRDNMDKLRTGDILSVAEVIKSLAGREKQKGLSTGERKMFTTAKQVLFTEIRIVCGIEEDEIEAAIKKGLALDD